MLSSVEGVYVVVIFRLQRRPFKIDKKSVALLLCVGNITNKCECHVLCVYNEVEVFIHD